MIFWHIVVLGTTNESAVLSYARSQESAEVYHV